MDTPPVAPEPKAWSAPQERVIVQLIHWGTVLLVVVAVAILGLSRVLDHEAIASIYGTIIGHAGTNAAMKLSSRAG